ncbi:MAG: Rpn family recombination-promoting nuclease/putative transposase [Myxococcales bacterium]|nr:Rpn family recombination-promoting nuclease/putative transposase [Myxococcales bacterium]
MSTTPHDALFKAIFSQPEQARELFAQVLPEEVLSRLDLRELTLEPGSYIDDALRSHHTDLLFTTTCSGRPARIYILTEHLSKGARWVPLRLHVYMGKIWIDSVAAKPPPRWLPVIIPIVVHHGDGAREWRPEDRFESLFDPESPAQLQGFVPKFRVVIDDLGDHDDDSLKRRAMSAISRLTFAALRHARTAEELRPFVPGWTELVREVLREPDGGRALLLVFRYLCQVRGEREIPTLRKIAVDAAKEADMRTIADMFRDEGFEAGERSLLHRQLRSRFGELPETLQARLDSADKPTLERLADRVLFASSLDEVFAG